MQYIKRYAVPQNTGGTFITACDYIAAKLMIALTRLGYSVPGDFAVAGFCNIGFSSLTTPALTTVKVDPAELAWNAVDMLMAQIEGKESGNQSRLIPVGVIRRESL